MQVEKTIAGRRCRLYGDGTAQALLIQPVDAGEAAVLDDEAAAIQALVHTPFMLAAFTVQDWQSELSPWPAPPIFGDRGFGSGAGQTLDFITGALLPALCAGGRTLPCYLGGYSLAGLFSLWAAYQTDIFQGVAAVSPSVWFPGWTAYAAAHAIRTPTVYLSLGDKEARTRNRVMATVQDALCRQQARLAADPAVRRCTLEYNPGNHFTQPAARTAKGFAWLLNN